MSEAKTDRVVPSYRRNVKPRKENRNEVEVFFLRTSTTDYRNHTFTAFLKNIVHISPETCQEFACEVPHKHFVNWYLNWYHRSARLSRVIAPKILEDTNGWHEVVAGEKVHVCDGCSVVVHPGAEAFIEGGARAHAYDGALVHLLHEHSLVCFDGQPDLDGIGFRLKHRKGYTCGGLIR